jgi:hypothetical protein
MTIDTALRELESLLPGLNYVVSFRRERVLPISGGTPEQYIVAALGPKAVVGGVSEVTGSELLAEVESSIRWPGDIGSGPPKQVLRSRRLRELVAGVSEHLEQVIAESESIWRFWLKDGHPFYPVQWDFAFVLVGPGGAEVFLGSSSD